MSTVTLKDNDSGSFCGVDYRATSNVWATARNAASGSNYASRTAAGMYKSGSDYTIYRTHFLFNAAAAGLSGKMITSAYLRLNIQDDEWSGYGAPGDDDYHIVAANGCHNVLDESDYGRIGTVGNTSFGSKPMDELLYGYYDIPLNAAGIAYLNTWKDSIIDLGVRGGYDLYNTPSDTPSMRWFGAYTGEDAWLVITCSDLEVQTDDPTNVSNTGATLNGTLVEDGSDTPVTVSFVAGLTSACSDWAGGSSNGPEGNSVTAEFAAVAAGVGTPGATIYYKAKAVGNSTATVYGAVKSFRLADYPSRPLTRVCGIRGVFHAGIGGQGGKFYMELLLGGLYTDWIPSVNKYTPSVGEQSQSPNNMGIVQRISQQIPTFPPDWNNLQTGMNRFRPGNLLDRYFEAKKTEPNLKFSDYKKRLNNG